MHVAHIRSTDNEIQTVNQHLLETNQIAEIIGTKIQMKHVAGLAGLLHDMGKFTEEFKNYIVQAVNNPNNPPKRGSVDHSTAGGRLLYERYYSIDPINKLLVEVVGNAILSHHGYLQDYINPKLELKFLDRIKNKELMHYDEAKHNFFSEVISELEFDNYVNLALNELKHFISQLTKDNQISCMMFLTKYIFSALIDADRTSTRCFEENIALSNFDNTHSFESDYEKLTRKLNSFKNDSDNTTPINNLRHQMSEQCDKIADKKSDIYTLSIPTGGGKTLSSLRYALKHAKEYNKKRIIYIVPFTTIIEQNADQVRSVVQESTHVLEHHSNIFDENAIGDLEDVPNEHIYTLAKDNWDAPIIFSTMVQFLNVFYSSGTRNIRRMHNLTDSVIIFDEVQKVPVKCISLFNSAVNFLKDYCHSSVVLCTATQPALKSVEHNLSINQDSEMIKDINRVNKEFKRVNVFDYATNDAVSTKDLSDLIKKHSYEVNSQLIILNTKSVVKKLYLTLKETMSKTQIYHLSTSMCASHRRKILNDLRMDLKQKIPVICISTQLIEAGVDISFESVIRSLSGLDSIAQAAGRCNRNGEVDSGNVYIIKHEEEKTNKLIEISKGKDITEKMLKDLYKDPDAYGGDILSREAMSYYFKRFYKELEEELNYYIRPLEVRMTDLLITDNSLWFKEYSNKSKAAYPSILRGSYQTAAKYFEVIDSHTTSVLVPYGEGKELIADINGNEHVEELSKIFRKAQHFSVNVYDVELKSLRSQGVIREYFDGNLLALDEGFYNKEYGLDVEGESHFSEVIF